MRDAAQKCGVAIVTGDTKVVDKGKGDGLFINTTGLGSLNMINRSCHKMFGRAMWCW